MRVPRRYYMTTRMGGQKQKHVAKLLVEGREKTYFQVVDLLLCVCVHKQNKRSMKRDF